ncbi:MAG: histidine--tRNA ligase [Chlamydiales bacterium]
MSYHIAKGVFDILPKDAEAWRESHLWEYLESQVRAICHLYGYREIRTPLFELTELFTRSIGLNTDIVSKEMYTFQDKGGRSLTLRPEGTTPVMRAFIEKNLHQISSIHKFFYLCPMFRYERQQAGRYRQHYQFGVEAIGSNSPYQDVEIIQILWSFYKKLGLQGFNLHINSIGDAKTRENFRDALKNYLKPYFNDLSLESQKRYQTNPIRILDSKNSKDQELLTEAPLIYDFLSNESKTHYQEFCNLLEEEKIPFISNPKLVRGLDYYNNIVFEITSAELGSQNSLGGGGRYDGLMTQLGGPNLPACGFGTGIERIIQTMIAQKVNLPTYPHPLLFMIPIGEKAKKKCFHIMNHLRQNTLPVEMAFNETKLRNSMRYADIIGAKYTVVIGENEINSGKVEMKEMASGNIKSLPLDRLLDELQKNT